MERREKNSAKLDRCFLFFLFSCSCFQTLTLLQLGIVGLFDHSQDAVVVGAHRGEGVDVTRKRGEREREKRERERVCMCGQRRDGAWELFFSFFLLQELEPGVTPTGLRRTLFTLFFFLPLSNKRRDAEEHSVVFSRTIGALSWLHSTTTAATPRPRPTPTSRSARPG